MKKNIVEKETAAKLAAAFRELPARATCPKCRRSRPKEKFGLRVMSRDARGLPKSIRRQSYCAECRGG